MTLYVLLAFALGALSAVTEAPVTRPAIANVVRCASRAERRRGAAVVATTRRAARVARFAVRSAIVAVLVPEPMTGAACPRAPGLGR